MVNRLLEACASLLAAAVAIYMSVRVIELVARPLIVIVAVIGGVIVAGFIVRMLWWRHRMNRW